MAGTWQGPTEKDCAAGKQADWQSWALPGVGQPARRRVSSPLPSSAMSCTSAGCHGKTEVKGLLPGKGQNSRGEAGSKTHFSTDRWEERRSVEQRESLGQANSILLLQVQPLSRQINHYIWPGIIYYQLRKATDSISSTFWLSCPMPQSVISLHLCQWVSSVKAIIMVTNCASTNGSWQHTCKQGDG